MFFVRSQKVKYFLHLCHDIVGMLDTHLNQDEVNVMIINNKTFFQNFHDHILILSQTPGIMVLLRKTGLFNLVCHTEVTPNCLAVRLNSTLN